MTHPSVNLAEYDRPGVRMFLDLSRASTNLCKECVTESGLLLLVVLGAVIQFALGQRVERNNHSRQPRLGGGKHGVSRSAGVRVPGGRTTLGFFCPHARVLFVGEILDCPAGVPLTVREPLDSA